MGRRNVCHAVVVGLISFDIAADEDLRGALAAALERDGYQVILRGFQARYLHGRVLLSMPLGLIRKRALRNEVGPECAKDIQYSWALLDQSAKQAPLTWAEGATHCRSKVLK